MATTIGNTVSRIRNTIKAVKTDAFITDRFIYSLIQKHSSFYLKQEIEKKRYDSLDSLFVTIPCVDLVEIDRADECCEVQSGCTIMRTKDKLPGIMYGPDGPLLKNVSSIDGSTVLYKTDPKTFNRIVMTSGHKYNKNRYYWIVDNYLYIPDISWPQVQFKLVPDGDISALQCGSSPCTRIQDLPVPVPDYLFTLIEQNVLKELGFTQQVPQDPQIADKQSLTR